jgi:two-component system nitrogen regulation response regulator GlnG
MAKLLVIDDDRTVLHVVKRAFESTEVQVLTASTAEAGSAAVASERPDVVLLDIMLPQKSGLDLYEHIHRADPKLPVIFITARDDSETAIKATMLGVYDYVVKPLELPRLRDLVRQALETRKVMDVPVEVSADEAVETSGDLLVGCSSAMLNVYKAIGRIASRDVTVLIYGESGTGKELVARAICQHSQRADGPFLAVNCAALTESLLESELFGHEKGSFTGAESRRIGKFEQCSGGTIFLDEVGDMTPLVQSKVLRLLQEQRFERVGGNTTIETDVRIIAATNRDLDQMVREGKFRSDLYYRLNGVTIEIPPLRERGDDIVLLLEHFLARYKKLLGKKEMEGISPEAVDLLKRYPWPGNVRELQSVVKMALMNATGPVIVSEFLPEDVRDPRSRESASHGNGRRGACDIAALIRARMTAGTDNLYAETLEVVERELLTSVLTSTKGNQSQAARILGITRGSLRNKIRSLGISIDHAINVDDNGNDTL